MNKIPGNIPDKEKFKKCISFFSEKYGVEIFFCDIKGSRWSYIDGSKNLVSNYSKFILRSNLGICVQNTAPDISCEIASSLEQFFL
ncbi:hypothetical protein [Peptoclostridium litorale]|nr:hypothetical protein [Peptoclostridium litorale]